MTRRAELSDISQRLIDLIGKAASAVIIPQLRQAASDISQTASSASEKDLEALLDLTLRRVFSRQPILALGVRKTIRVNVGPFLKPGSHEATTTFTPSNGSLLPIRMIQRPDVPIVKEAKAEFAEVLVHTVQKDVAYDIGNSGQGVCDTFAREQKLHKQRHSMGSGQPCCIFKLMEEDYELPEHVGKTEIICFQFKCGTCGGRHELRILR